MKKHVLIGLMALYQTLSYAADTPAIKTIFYQGMGQSMIQAAILTPKGFVAPTGERVLSQNAIEVVLPNTLFTQHEIDEVSYYPILFSGKKSPTFLSSPFWVAKSWAWNYFYGTSITPEQNPINSNFEGRTIARHAVHPERVNIGQKRDVENHQKKVALCNDAFAGVPQVHIGVSRGALTTFRANALHKYNNVKCVILEGCPDDVPHTSQERFGNFVGVTLYNALINKVCEHDPKQEIPLASLCEQFPKNVPVLFITSELDKTVTKNCTQTIAQTLKNAGHPDVYLIILQHSSHPGYASDNKDDIHMYEIGVNAFYQYAQVPGYNAEKAALGQSVLAKAKL